MLRPLGSMAAPMSPYSIPPPSSLLTLHSSPLPELLNRPALLPRKPVAQADPVRLWVDEPPGLRRYLRHLRQRMLSDLRYRWRRDDPFPIPHDHLQQRTARHTAVKCLRLPDHHSVVREH